MGEMRTSGHCMLPLMPLDRLTFVWCFGLTSFFILLQGQEAQEGIRGVP